MNPNPFSALLHSRKFWLLILDTIVSGVALVCGWYLSPENLEKVVAIIALIQPVYVSVIVGIFAEDNAERRLEGEKLYYIATEKKDGDGQS